MVRELQNEIKGVTIFVQNSCKLMDKGKAVLGEMSCMGEDVDIASSNDHGMLQAMINCIFTSHPNLYGKPAARKHKYVSNQHANQSLQKHTSEEASQQARPCYPDPFPLGTALPCLTP